jgi:hypothetical protein
LAARTFARVRGVSVEHYFCAACSAYHIRRKRRMTSIERLARNGDDLLQRLADIES